MDEINKNQKNDAAQTENAPIETAEEKLQKCEQEKNEYLKGWQRARADFENYKKDENRRRVEIIQFANQELITDLLQVLDSFHLARTVTTDSGAEEKIKKGMEMIEMQIEDTLKKYGLEEIKTENEKFDPLYHEAIEEISSDTESGTIIEIISKGYFLNGKVIRPARVKIAK